MKKILERHKKTRTGQRGGMLLEVLVSVLLFALGIVALVGLQGRSLVVTDDVQYRAEAMHFANAYMGKIWAAASGGTMTGDGIADEFSGGTGGTNGDSYDAFSSLVQGAGSIPGAEAPEVAITDNSEMVTLPDGTDVLLRSVDVRITISWRDREDSAVTRNYTQVSSVGLNI